MKLIDNNIMVIKKLKIITIEKIIIILIIFY